MPGPELFLPLSAVRVVAEPAVIDAALGPAAGTTAPPGPLRVAPDDALVPVEPGTVAAAVTTLGAAVLPADPHAIVEPESAFVGAWFDLATVRRWVAHHGDWHLPPGDGLSQGMVAAVPVKIAVADDRALVMTEASLGPELSERFGADPGVGAP